LTNKNSILGERPENSQSPATGEIQMKTMNEIKHNFKNDDKLEYIDMYIFPNNSCYRGQMKKVSDLNQKEQ
jgi:hypothetical protein